MCKSMTSENKQKNKYEIYYTETDRYPFLEQPAFFLISFESTHIIKVKYIYLYTIPRYILNKMSNLFYIAWNALRMI